MGYEFQGRTRSRSEAEGRSGRPARASRQPGPKPEREPRQPIHAFAATMGLAFLLAGVGGFVPGVTSNYDELKFSGPDSMAKLVGLFQISVLHNVVHLLFAVGLIAAARFSWSRAYLLGGGVLYLGVAVYGAVVERGSDADFLPINDADTLLHVGLALTMIVLGLVGTRLWKRRMAPAA